MSLPRIELRQVGKQFTIRRNATATLKDGVIRLLSRRRFRTDDETFWALKDINVTVSEGEVVGILGPNGAGKSTLLRIVAQTMRPTCGEVAVRGRVTPLLSFGLGFHPELTGRENIYHNTSFYGLTRAKTNEIIDPIVAFSELERFIDSPVKNYSTGMRMRLGFSIAVHLDLDILVIDEVLSVGDKAFHGKSSAKMLELIKSGKTVLLTSHNLMLIKQLCHKVYLLNHGIIEAEGEPEHVIQVYQDGGSKKPQYPEQVTYAL
ncbi:MAG: ABC transporter ATP-binding protein [Rhodothermales bacterium]